MFADFGILPNPHFQVKQLRGWIPSEPRRSWMVGFLVSPLILIPASKFGLRAQTGQMSRDSTSRLAIKTTTEHLLSGNETSGRGLRAHDAKYTNAT